MSDRPHPEDRHIVVGVDGSRGSTTALRWALTQAHRTGAVVDAVAAWQQPATYNYPYGSIPLLLPDDSIAATAEKALNETVAAVVATTDRPVEVRTTVAHGPAAQVLLEAATDADLLVVGSRGHGAFAGMLLGSVSQHCIQHAPCPVVVIPDDDPPATS